MVYILNVGENANPSCSSFIVPTKEELGWQLWSQLAQQKSSNAQSH